MATDHTGEKFMGRCSRTVTALCMLSICPLSAWATTDTRAAAPLPAPGVFAQGHIVVQLTEPFARTMRAQARDEPLQRLEATGARALVASTRNWRVTRMRPVFAFGFANPNGATRHGLDRYFIVETPQGADIAAMVTEFAAHRDEIAAASVDAIGGVAAPLPNDTDFHRQWGMHNDGSGTGWVQDADIDAPEAWQIESGQTAGPITIAIIDSGVNQHIEFSGRLVPGINTADPDPTGTEDDCSIAHGTHVAGIAAGRGDNGVGVAGVCWGCSIMPIDVLRDLQGGCSGSVTDLAEGITWAADHGADVINMSLQYCGLTPIQQAMLESAVNYAHDLGAVLVAATGNNNLCGPGQIAWPARFANTLAVGGITAGGEVAVNAVNANWTSNTGPEIDVVAPGDQIYSCSVNDGYRYISGTSMATPHVSGLAALLRHAAPTLTNAEVKQLIEDTADDVAELGWDSQSGHGRANALRALQTTLPPSTGVPASSTWTMLFSALLALIIGSHVWSARRHPRT